MLGLLLATILEEPVVREQDVDSVVADLLALLLRSRHGSQCQSE